LGRDEGAVGAHLGGPAPPRVEEDGSRREEAALDEGAEGNPGLVALGGGVDQLGRAWLDRGDALARQRRVFGVALDADEAAAEPLGDGPGRAGAEERVE